MRLGRQVSPAGSIFWSRSLEDMEVCIQNGGKGKRTRDVWPNIGATYCNILQHNFQTCFLICWFLSSAVWLFEPTVIGVAAEQQKDVRWKRWREKMIIQISALLQVFRTTAITYVHFCQLPRLFNALSRIEQAWENAASRTVLGHWTLEGPLGWQASYKLLSAIGEKMREWCS